MALAFQIRVALPAEADGLAAIEKAAASLFPADRIPDPDHTFPRDRLIEASRQSLLFVAIVDERLVGFATSHQAADMLHLDELAVHPRYGRRGIGRALTQTVIDASSTRGLRGVTLTTFSDLPWNGPFYESMGFRSLSEDALTGTLKEALTEERALGMVRRVAMCFASQDPAG